MKYFKSLKIGNPLPGYTISFIVLFFLTSCTPQVIVKEETGSITTEQHSIKTESETYEESATETEPDLQTEAEQVKETPQTLASVASTDPSEMMYELKQKFDNAIANSAIASIKQEGDFLTVVLSSDALFDGKSSSVRPEAEDEVSRIAAIIVQYPQLLISVEGHTDSKGADIYNMKLSKQRAEAVKKILVQSGYDDSQIKTAPLGESVPAASNQTVAGRKKNRRVEIRIKPLE